MRTLPHGSRPSFAIGLVRWLAVLTVAVGTNLGGTAPRLEAQDPPSPSPAKADSPDEIRLEPDGPLPWDKPKGDNPLPPRKLASPAELLDLYGMNRSQLNSFFDGRSLSEDEQEALAKLLFRLPQFSLDDVQRWARPLPKADQLAADPEPARIQMFAIEGRVERVERVVLLPEVARLYDFKHYYVLHVRLPDSSIPVRICTPRVPRQWPIGEPMDEPTRLKALFLKVGGPTPDGDELVFAAARPAWLPDRVGGEVTRHHVLLASLGMDISRFDDVRSRNRQSVGAEDRECFYQLLSAVKKSKPDVLAAAADQTKDLAPLLQDPKSQHGRLMTWEGTARRITRVVVDAPDIRQRYGIDHYYQLDVFLPLGERTVRLGKPGDAKTSPVYINNYPATFCVLTLPKELQDAADRLAQGEIESENEVLNEQVRLTGFYFKLWAYRSEYVAAFDDSQRQISPMIFASQPEVLHPSFGQSPFWSTVVGVTFLIALAFVWIGVWRNNRSDRNFKQETLRRQYELKGKSLDEMGIEVPDGPDFSGLD